MTAPLTAGACREEVWTALMRARACAYPLPPHGHHPNFSGAAAAARALLSAPGLSGVRALVVGPERALQPLRRLALRSGVTLYVPVQNPEAAQRGWYWHLTDPAAARLSAMPGLGEAVPPTEVQRAQGVVLGSVAVDDRGGRLGKGFGWGARGLNLGLPEYTLAHPLMRRAHFPFPPDSQVRLVGLPGAVLGPFGEEDAPAVPVPRTDEA